MRPGNLFNTKARAGIGRHPVYYSPALIQRPREESGLYESAIDGRALIGDLQCQQVTSLPKPKPFISGFSIPQTVLHSSVAWLTQHP